MIVRILWDPKIYVDVGLPMWTLYDHPTDYPGHFVLRLYDAMDAKPTEFIFLAETLEDIEKAMPDYFFRMDRDPDDDPKIMATFI